MLKRVSRAQCALWSSKRFSASFHIIPATYVLTKRSAITTTSAFLARAAETLLPPHPLPHQPRRLLVATEVEVAMEPQVV